MIHLFCHASNGSLISGSPFQTCRGVVTDEHLAIDDFVVFRALVSDDRLAVIGDLVDAKPARESEGKNAPMSHRLFDKNRDVSHPMDPYPLYELPPLKQNQMPPTRLHLSVSLSK